MIVLSPTKILQNPVHDPVLGRTKYNHSIGSYKILSRILERTKYNHPNGSCKILTRTVDRMLKYLPKSHLLKDTFYYE